MGAALFQCDSREILGEGVRILEVSCPRGRNQPRPYSTRELQRLSAEVIHTKHTRFIQINRWTQLDMLIHHLFYFRSSIDRSNVCFCQLVNIIIILIISLSENVSMEKIDEVIDKNKI